MTVNAINGGQINRVRFPGAADGLSLVEMSGLVEVTATIPSIHLRLHASASTAAAAQCATSSVRHNSRLGATTFAAAQTDAVEQKKIATVPEALQAVASAAATVHAKFRFLASGSGAAVHSALAVNKAARSASTTGQALSTVSVRRRVPVAASGFGAAQDSVTAFRAILRDADTQAQATTLASISFRTGVEATTATSADGEASIAFKRLAQAQTTAAATAPATLVGYRVLLRPSPQSAVADVPPLAAGAQITVGGAASVARAYAQSGARAKYKLSAAVMARAIAGSSAEDYGLLINAPTERLMVVPASDRRMEVTL